MPALLTSAHFLDQLKKYWHSRLCQRDSPLRANCGHQQGGCAKQVSGYLSLSSSSEELPSPQFQASWLRSVSRVMHRCLLIQELLCIIFHHAHARKTLARPSVRHPLVHSRYPPLLIEMSSMRRLGLPNGKFCERHS